MQKYKVGTSQTKLRGGLSATSFPLTPALSLGEREKRLHRLGETDALESSDALPFGLLKRGGEARTARSFITRANGLPLPKGEGRGEGEGADQTLARVPFASGLEFPNLRRLNGPAVVGQWMRRTLLQCLPNRVADGLLLSAQPRIPKPQHLDAFGFQLCVSNHVYGSLFGMTMPTAIEFDIQ